MQERRPLQSIPDDELLHRLAELMGQSRRVEADIVAHIAEVDERRLYAREAFPSMFVYCMDVLHLSEADDQGRRCSERDRLELHHRHPFGLGGDHGVPNIRLMCRAHNAYLAECVYGREAMARHRRARSRASPAAAG